MSVPASDRSRFRKSPELRLGPKRSAWGLGPELEVLGLITTSARFLYVFNPASDAVLTISQLTLRGLAWTLRHVRVSRRSAAVASNRVRSGPSETQRIYMWACRNRRSWRGGMDHETSVAATVLLEELRALGSFGPATVELLLDTAREELGRFPGLTADAASTFEDYAYDFFLDRGKALTVAIRLEAEDDAALGRMIRRWLRNWLIDLNSQTALGALRDRLEKRMSRDGRFGRAPVGHYWRLNDGPAEAATVDLATLASVARRVHVTFFPEPPDGSRRAQLGRAGELETLLAQLFKTAQGSLHISTLVHVIANRFPHVLDPLTVSTEDEATELAAAGGMLPLELVVEDEDHEYYEKQALAAFESLSAQERDLVLVLDDPKAAAAMLELGKSTTALRIRGLKSKLVEISGDEMSAREVVRRVIALCAGVSEGGPGSAPEDTTRFVPSVQDGGQKI